jgi:O-acetyl-ADP-ribose deacetylase (regulator of RNase III)
MPEILRADITTLAVDAIVNAANEALRGGGGVDGAIHRAAGPELLEACRRYPGCATGEAVLTPGFRLPARYVIHTVGPVWRGGGQGEPALLERAYRSVFRVARERGDIRTIAFPAISTGVYGYPRPAAAAIALRVMREHEGEFERIVVAVVDRETEEAYGVGEGG